MSAGIRMAFSDARDRAGSIPVRLVTLDSTTGPRGALGSGPGAGQRGAGRGRLERHRLHRRARPGRVRHLRAGDQRRQPAPGVALRRPHQPHPQPSRARGPRRAGAVLPERPPELRSPRAERPPRGRHHRGAPGGPGRDARGASSPARASTPRSWRHSSPSGSGAPAAPSWPRRRWRRSRDSAASVVDALEEAHPDAVVYSGIGDRPANELLAELAKRPAVPVLATGGMLVRRPLALRGRPGPGRGVQPVPAGRPVRPLGPHGAREAAPRRRCGRRPARGAVRLRGRACRAERRARGRPAPPRGGEGRACARGPAARPSAPTR